SKMFALWYLSLAVDELRKRFGWTFFDIFYKTNKTDTHALDNKPANDATPNPVEPAKPSVSKPTPTVAPKVAPTPAPAPAPKPAPAPAPAPVVKPEPPKPAPVVEPPKPAPVAKPEPPKPAPVVEPPKPAPVVEPPKPAPVVEPPKPAPVVEPPKPAPVVEPPKPFTAPIAPMTPIDTMDKKLMETSKPQENGENLRNNIKNATMDFLSGEANNQSSTNRRSLFSSQKILLSGENGIQSMALLN
ncbi:hypothetical protein FF38_05504, partial [Lucilia cuprina]